MGVFGCIGGVVRTIIRWGLLVANVFFLLAGVALVVMGAIIYITTDKWDEFYTQESQMSAILCMGGGGGTIITALLGFYAALKKKSWALNLYFGLMAVSFGVLLTGGIYAFNSEHYFTVVVRMNMEDHLNSAIEGNSTSMILLNKLQSDYKCCGVRNARDWITVEVAAFPPACNCKQGTEGCSPFGDLYIYSSGCYDSLHTYVYDLKTGLGGLAFTISGLEVMAGIAALCLGGSYK